jgi:hypothetical protein
MFTWIGFGGSDPSRDGQHCTMAYVQTIVQDLCSKCAVSSGQKQVE